MNSLFPEGMNVRGWISKIILHTMYIASALISALWFARVMPDLLVPSNSTVLPAWVGPTLAGIVGVAFMELAVVAWNHQVKETNLNPGQTWVAWFGLGSSLGMSAATTFAAVMFYVGNSPDPVGERVVAWATNNGVAYYMFLQLILVALFAFIFNPSAAEREVSRPQIKSSKPGKQQNRPTERPQQLPQSGPGNLPPALAQAQPQRQEQQQPRRAPSAPKR